MKIMRFLSHLINSLLNGKSFFGLVSNFFFNFFPVLLWLILFKNASLIPVNWRPKINIKWLPYADNLCFNPLLLSSYIFYLLIILFFILPFSYFLLKINKNKLLFALLIFSCPLLNLVNYLASINQNFKLDLLSFISYVLLHLIIPILTSIYLYLFQIPGILSCYSWSLGLQNILGLITHLILPSSPPWFIHLNGINSIADYSTLGYAAGLTRIDTSFGNHLTTNGFHKSPIVFGALPSLHSAMAFLTCIFISYFSNSSFLSILSIFYVLLQWFSTIYLDHHWRLDLFVGMCYSIVSFSIIKILNHSIFNYNSNYNSNSNHNLIDYNKSNITNSNLEFSSTDTLFNYNDNDNDNDNFDLELQSFNDDYNHNNSSSSSLTAISNNENLVTIDNHNNNKITKFCSNVFANTQPTDMRPAGLRIFSGTLLESLFT